MAGGAIRSRSRLRPRARDRAASGLDAAARTDRPAASAAGLRWIATADWPQSAADLRARLLSVIASGTGPDRQCHLTMRSIAGRARSDTDAARREMRALISDGIVSRFQLPNGDTATMLTQAAHG